MGGGPTRPPLPEIGRKEQQALLKDLIAVGVMQSKGPVSSM